MQTIKDIMSVILKSTFITQDMERENKTESLNVPFMTQIGH